MKLSIIIPYYNAKQYTDELLRVLAPQITPDVEILLIDDGSAEPFKSRYKWLKVTRQKNKGGAGAKNTGMDKAQGDYITFVDADDMIPEYYIERLLEKIDATEADVIDFSWKSLSTEGAQHNYKLNNDNDRLKNPSVCTRAFKRSYIGDMRMNEKKDATYDEDFSRKMGYLDPNSKHTHASIPDYMYYYRTALDDSSIHKFKKGLKKTKRIVYYFNYVTKDMTWLLDEIRKEDDQHEVWLLTNQNDIPELARWCQISRPKNIWAHILRGEPYSRCEIINPPISTQIVVYCEYANVVGGIGTFIYNFCQNMSKYYDILFIYDRFDIRQVRRLAHIVPVRKNDGAQISCEVIILNRLTDKIPENLTYNQSIQICHACKQKVQRIPQNRDVLVNVSQAARDSWGEESAHGIVIHNMTYNDARDCLLLVSATRMPANDKGDNEKRMRKLAEMLNRERIPFIWLNFSDGEMSNPPAGFINMKPSFSVQDYIKKADYLVQLSDREAYPYSTLEALDNGTAVICTPVESFFEQGVVDGENGYIVPFDMDFDVKKLLNVPSFEFEYDNETIIKQWKKVLSITTKAKHDYKPDKLVDVEVTKRYYDTILDKTFQPGEIATMEESRARMVAYEHGYGRII